MCGIAGVLSANPALDVSASIGGMTHSLRHRGPDCSGQEIRTFAGVRVGLGHTRLSILDLSEAGKQPMRSADARMWLTYNGETYNFQELRRRLVDRGAVFRSQTDTEVILEAFARWGPDSLGRLRGMFALGVWDERTGTLTLARDPFGIKPLYYAAPAGGQSFVFASEIRALLRSRLVSGQVSPDGLRSYLQTGSITAPATILSGVRSLMPGEYLQVRIRNGSIEVGSALPYADPVLAHAAAVEAPAQRAEAVAQLRSVLAESIRLHRISDVPLGVFLSGGIDSSAIVALVKSVTGTPPKTFSVVFGEQQFSEQQHARRIADEFETDHSEVLLTEDDLLAQLPEALGALDQPSMDGFNTYVISKAVRQAGVTVALSGLGGDELFAGYSSFARALRLRPLAFAPDGVRRYAAALGRKWWNGSVQREKLWDLLASDISPAAAYRISRRLFSDPEIGHLFPLANTARTAAADGMRADPINCVSRLELRGYMANTLLRDTDSMSMAHSIEVRVPFVDRDVARYVLSLPGSWKFSRTRPKPLLLDALNGLLPESVWNRPKMGFSLPFERWMRSSLQPEITRLLAAPALSSIGVDRACADSVWRTLLDRPQAERWSRAWSLYVLGRWCEQQHVSL
jgi:asparagine synthase (glutamine-hydrolysing)